MPDVSISRHVQIAVFFGDGQTSPVIISLLRILETALAYLKSYFQRRAFNLLFPVSIAIGLAITIGSAAAALEAEVGGAAQVGFTLTFALGALALVEHAFMVAPFRDSTLWRWAMSPAAVDRAYKDTGRMP